MSKIHATEDCRFAVRASIAQVYGFFADPDRIREVTPDVCAYQRLSPVAARWELVSKTEKGITFGPSYTVEYLGNGLDRVEWRSTAGNMEVAGTVELFEKAGGTEVHYRETVGPDLPITPILAKLLRPFVARELRQDIARFVERARQRLDASCAQHAPETVIAVGRPTGSEELR